MATVRQRSRALSVRAIVLLMVVAVVGMAALLLAAASRSQAARAEALGADVRALAGQHMQGAAIVLAAVETTLRVASSTPAVARLADDRPGASAEVVMELTELFDGMPRPLLWERLLFVSVGEAPGSERLLASIATGRLLDRLYPPAGFEVRLASKLFDETGMVVGRAAGGGKGDAAEAVMALTDLAADLASLRAAHGRLGRVDYAPRTGIGPGGRFAPLVRVGMMITLPTIGEVVVAADLDTAVLLRRARAGMELPPDAEVLLVTSSGVPLARAFAGLVVHDPSADAFRRAEDSGCPESSLFGCGWNAMLASGGDVADLLDRAARATERDPDILSTARASLDALGLTLIAYRPAPPLLDELLELAPAFAGIAVLTVLLLWGLVRVETRRLTYSLDLVAQHIREVWTEAQQPDLDLEIPRTEALKQVVGYVSKLLEDLSSVMLAAFGPREGYWVEEAFSDITGAIDRLLTGAMDTERVAAERDLARALQQKEEEYSRNLQSAYEKLETTHEQLKEAQAQLVHSEKMVSLGQLVAGIAHEINNPINFISQNVDSLADYIADLQTVLAAYDGLGSISKQDRSRIDAVKEKHELELVLEDLAKLLRDVKVGAERTRKIVLDLRSFSRLDEAEVKSVDLHDGIESTLNLLRNTTKNRIEIVRDFQAPRSLRCYAGQLNQVFMNVLNNAQQAIADQGTITIRTFAEGDDVVIAVRDTGRGIPEHALPNIFDPFYTTKDVGKGTGLGLSISHAIVERHGGRIEIETEVGKGTEFRIVLPASGPALKEPSWPGA